MPTPTPLSRLLQAWSVAPAANPQFRTSVWTRIARAQHPETWGAYLRGHATRWTVLALLTMLASGWIGRSTGQAESHATREKLADTYIESIDPRALVPGARRP